MSPSDEEFAARRRRWENQSGSTAIHGELAYVRISVHGFKRRQVQIHWSLYNNRTQERRTGGSSALLPQSMVHPEAPADDIVIEQWMDPAPGPDMYFARFEVRTPNGALLDVADSKPFHGL